jgi:hypothetical protein
MRTVLPNVESGSAVTRSLASSRSAVKARDVYELLTFLAEALYSLAGTRMTANALLGKRLKG